MFEVTDHDDRFNDAWVDVTDDINDVVESSENPYSDYYHSFSTKSRDKKFSKFLKMDSEKKWNTVRDFTSSQTKVSIHFFLNFQNFISGLIA